jgi:hypothetical protein
MGYFVDAISSEFAACCLAQVSIFLMGLKSFFAKL